MRFILGIIIVLMVCSCEEQSENKPPENLIPRQDLISIMIDLEIMEAYYEQVHKRPNIFKTTLDSASRTILYENNVTENQLKESLNYYSSMPDSLFVLYEEALDSLNSLAVSKKNKEN